ncbi:MAG TPA: VLRF1 family aeRF1-type release factor [Solirubrobacterales bacterium]|jgi:hypothetical protein|nr:VLRF1 family aeRF1-type release factor [Solirubrobacterales bacterium]
MRIPTPDIARQLLEWRPPLGVVSVFLDLNPADRGEPWRIELRDKLDAIVPKRQETELHATAERITAHFPGRGEKYPSGRYQIGFVEVAADPGREEWFELQAPGVRTGVCHDERAHLAPLIKALDQAPLTGVVAITADRVEFFEWSFGVVERLTELDYERPDDWHERKGPTVDPSRGTGVSSSGRDQFDQRLAENRGRFIRHAGEEAYRLSTERGWQTIVAFGDETLYRRFSSGFSDHVSEGQVLRHIGPEDLVAQPIHEIAELTSRRLAELEQQREISLVERAKNAALAREGRGALGAQATIDCLAAGRVEHLLYDIERDIGSALTVGHLTFIADGAIRRDNAKLSESILGRALETGASITPLEGASAAALSEYDGMAAILRY